MQFNESINCNCSTSSNVLPLNPYQAFIKLNKKFRKFNVGNNPWYNCGHIAFRYISGLLMTVDTNKISTICFTPISECDLALLPKSVGNKSYIVRYNYSEKLMQVLYVPQSTYLLDLCNVPEFIVISGHEMDLMDDHLFNGCYSLYPCAICNNLMYIQGLVPINSINQFLVSYSQSKVSDIVIKDTSAYVIINDRDIYNYYIPHLTGKECKVTYLSNQGNVLDPNSDYNLLDLGSKPNIPPVQNENLITSYIDFINNSDSQSIFVMPMDSEFPQIVNMYNISFDGRPSISMDTGVSGLIEEWAINDVRVFATFIKVLKCMYPEINFYTDNEDIDQTKFKEWINYNMRPRDLRSPLYNTHVFENKVFGRYWYTTLDFTLEYSCNDLPTVMARRDDYCAEKFLNDLKMFSVPLIKDESNLNPIYDLSSSCALFWDRDSFDSNLQQITYQDDTGYAKSTMTITGRIIFTNVQYKPRETSIVEHVICDIISSRDARNKVKTELSDNIHLEDHKPIDEPTSNDSNINDEVVNNAIDYEDIIKEYNKSIDEKVKGLIL